MKIEIHKYIALKLWKTNLLWQGCLWNYERHVGDDGIGGISNGNGKMD
jgi:hypothetical protein